MGVALQEAGLDPRQSGRELLVLQGRLFGLPPADAKTRAAELLELVELTDAADRRIKGYSGGMKRRSTSRPRSSTGPRCSSSTSPRPGSIPPAG